MNKAKNLGENKLDYKIVFLYAIATILVLLGHTNGIIDFGQKVIPYYTYHLGIFVFCSGYLYKDVDEEHIFKYIWKKIKKLIIPMYVWNLLYGIFVFILHSKGYTYGGNLTFHSLVISPLINGHQFIFNMGFWFVVPLFCVQVFNILLRKVLRKYKNEWAIFVLYLFIGIGGGSIKSAWIC